jgi:hypothetical protein
MRRYGWLIIGALLVGCGGGFSTATPPDVPTVVPQQIVTRTPVPTSRIPFPPTVTVPPAAATNAPVVAASINPAALTPPPLVIPTLPPLPTAAPPGATPTPLAPTAKPPTNTPAPKPGNDVRVPLAQSNQGTQEGQRVTIIKITDGAKSSDEFEHPGAGNKYIVMLVLIENVGTKEAPPGDWKLRTDTDFEYGTTFAAGFGDGLPYNSITSGGKIQGTIIFEVPATAKGKWLKYDPNPFTPGDLYFDFAP